MVSKHGSVQLSMSFLITIILSITMLLAGISLISYFYQTTTETQEQLDERTQQRLAELLGDGQQVVIPFNQQTIERGSGHVFGLGVLNIADEASFTVVVSVSSVYDENQQEVDISSLIDPAQWFLFDDTAQRIPKNEQRTVSLLIEVPRDAPSGLYNFNVEVLKDGLRYDRVQKIRITVP